MSSWTNTELSGGNMLETAKNLLTNPKVIWAIAGIIAVIAIIVIVILVVIIVARNKQIVALGAIPTAMLDAIQDTVKSYMPGDSEADDVVSAGYNPTPSTPAKVMISYANPADVSYGTSAGMSVRKPQSSPVKSTQALLSQSLG